MRNAIVMEWVIVSGMVTRFVPINVRIIAQNVAWPGYWEYTRYA